MNLYPVMYVQHSMKPAQEDTCRICKVHYTLPDGVRNPAGLCDVCGFLQRQEMLRSDAR